MAIAQDEWKPSDDELAKAREVLEWLAAHEEASITRNVRALAGLYEAIRQIPTSITELEGE